MKISLDKAKEDRLEELKPGFEIPLCYRDLKNPTKELLYAMGKYEGLKPESAPQL